MREFIELAVINNNLRVKKRELMMSGRGHFYGHVRSNLSPPELFCFSELIAMAMAKSAFHKFQPQMARHLAPQFMRL